MADFRRIGVLTSGGDAPGMNAVIRAVTRTALAKNIEVVGIVGGYSGLIEEKLIPLVSHSVSNIITKGGTFLYSNRCLEFKTEEGIEKAIATCQKYNIDAIVAIGGDGTFRGATELAVRGIPTIGITGTIDNDITASDYTIGFDTAMNTVIDVVDRIRDTCESHARCNVIEVMGRDCGDLTLQAGIATGAIAICIPEVPFDEQLAIDKIKSSLVKGKRGMVVLVSEGVYKIDENGKKIRYGEVLANHIQQETGVETKFARLAHIVRGGSPTLRDRLTATRMGAKAVELLLEGKSNLVVVEKDDVIDSEDIVYALTLDQMYKGRLKDGDLDRFTPEQIAKMEASCKERKDKITALYELSYNVCN
ncbi:MAG: 6-phosphofructokinase [Clostridia bacterium]|nr:6-phosphofructokinase [Clostridia bacterium]